MKIGRIAALSLLLVGLLSPFAPGPVLAQNEEEKIEKIELVPTYRKLEDTAPGASFEFEVALKFQGTEAREFDLSASAPAGWSVEVKPNFGEQRIGSIRLEPKDFPDKVKVVTSPPFFITPEPGDYTVTLEATSGNISGTIDLTAVITATYSLDIAPANERYNTKATVGQDNFFSIEIGNSGSGALESIKFSSRKPDGWTIEFTPEEIVGHRFLGFIEFDYAGSLLKY